MLNPDLLISAGIWLSGVGMSFLGVEMTIAPPTPERPRGKWFYRTAFTVLGVAFVALSYLQYDRIDREQKRQAKEHLEEQISNEGNQKYTQGQLDSMTKVLSLLAQNTDPGQWANAVRAAMPTAPSAPDTRSALERMGNRELRNRVLQFARILNEWAGRMDQTRRSMLEQRMAAMRLVPENDREKRDSVWNEWNARDAQFSVNYEVEFRRDFLGSAFAYRDEMIRRLGPQPPRDAGAVPSALEGWIAPLSVEATPSYLESLAYKLPEK